MMKIRILILLPLIISPAFGQTVSVDFDSPTVMGSFTQLNGSNGASSNFAYSAAAGVNGTGGAILSTSAPTSALYNATSFDFTSTTSFSASMDFHKGATTGDIFYFGLTGDLSRGINGGNSSTPIARLFASVSRSSADTYYFNLANAFATEPAPWAPVPFTALGSSFTLSDSSTNWYRISMDLVLTDAETATYDLTYSLYDLGADGTTTPSLIASRNSSIQNAVLLADDSAYIGFRANSDVYFTGGDNLEVTAIPEPSALCFLGVLAFGAMAYKRKSRGHSDR